MAWKHLEGNYSWPPGQRLDDLGVHSLDVDFHVVREGPEVISMLVDRPVEGNRINLSRPFPLPVGRTVLLALRERGQAMSLAHVEGFHPAVRPGADSGSRQAKSVLVPEPVVQHVPAVGIRFIGRYECPQVQEGPGVNAQVSPHIVTTLEVTEKIGVEIYDEVKAAVHAAQVRVPTSA